MSILSKLKYLLLPGHRRAVDRDLREELDSLAALAESEGARSDLGNLTRAAEEGRSAWAWTWLEQLSADVGYAARTMKRNPGFTATAVLSLALGIGANTAIFSLMNGILLKSLPVNDPDSLVVLTSYSKNDKIGDFGYRDYLALREGTSTLSGLMAASSLLPINAGIGGESEAVQHKMVSGNYFGVLGVNAVVGRTIRPEEEDQQVAVMGYRWWKRSFGGSPSVVGMKIDLDGVPATVIGVAPPDFLSETVGEAADVWATFSLMPAARRDSPGYTWLNLMGRLKPGAGVREASASLSLLAPQMQNRFIDRVEVTPGKLGGPGLRDTFRIPLTALMALAGVALLIACTNVSGLLLARAAGRQREIATRLAIGASRGRVVRQLLTESVSLAMLGGFLGLLFAAWGQRVLLRLVAGVGRSISIDLRPDLSVLLFTAAVSIGVGVLFGLAPALHAIRENTGEALKLNGSRPAGHRRGWGLRDALLTFQVALSMMLLVVGGLFIRTLENLKHQDLGVRAGNVLAVQLGVQRGHRPVWPRLIPELLRRVEAVPGVKSASASFNGTLANASGINGFQFEGWPATEEVQRAAANWVSPGYFETLGIPLLEGREFLPSDTAGSPRVAIINRTMAHRYVGSEHAVGRRFRINRDSYEIIGVARDGKYSDLREATPSFVYFAALQSNSDVHILEIRTAASPSAAAREIRNVVREADPGLRVVEIATLEQRIDQMVAREALVANLAGFFGGLTLVLAVVGVYGTLAYAVARRTREIGIRIALGAQFGAIAGTVMRNVLAVGAIGLACGVAGALAAGKLVGSLLFGLKATDPGTIGLAAVILGMATLAAGCIPVLRVSRIDPTIALRLE